MRQTFENFQYSKTMSNVFSTKKLINLCVKIHARSVEENFHVTSCGKSCVCYPYLLKASSYLFKRVNKVFNLIHVVICQRCKGEYIGETGCLIKKRISVYRQHIRQLQYQQIKVEEHMNSGICWMTLGGWFEFV